VRIAAAKAVFFITFVKELIVSWPRLFSAFTNPTDPPTRAEPNAEAIA
jgi:hypothetical protein